MKEFGVPTWRTGSIPFFGMAGCRTSAMGPLLQCQVILAKGPGGERGKSLGSGKQVFPLPISRHYKGCSRIYLGIFKHREKLIEGVLFLVFFQRCSNTEQITDNVTFFPVFKSSISISGFRWCCWRHLDATIQRLRASPFLRTWAIIGMTSPKQVVH